MCRQCNTSRARILLLCSVEKLLMCRRPVRFRRSTVYVIADPVQDLLIASLNGLVDALTRLERILTTPIPFSWILLSLSVVRPHSLTSGPFRYSIHLWVVTTICCLTLVDIFPFFYDIHSDWFYPLAAANLENSGLVDNNGNLYSRGYSSCISYVMGVHNMGWSRVSYSLASL